MMPQAAANSQNAGGSAPYNSNLEHLEDELARLDLLIRIRMGEQRNGRDPSPLDPFRGLVVSEEEVASLLNREVTPGDRAVEQTLREHLREVESRIAERLRASAENNVFLPMPHLSRLFQLGPFEERCVTICLAPELDRKYEKLYAYLQDDVTRKKPSVDLALALAAGSLEQKMAARLAFRPESTLFRYRLVQLSDCSPDGRAPLLSHFLKLEDRVVDLLLGVGRTESLLEPMASLVCGGRDAASAAPQQVLNRLTGIVRSYLGGSAPSEQSLVIYLHGPYGSGKRALAKAVSTELGLALLVVDVEKMIEGSLPLEEAAWLAGREALLQPAILCFNNLDVLIADERGKSKVELLLNVATECSALTLLCGRQPWRPLGDCDRFVFVEAGLRMPDDAERVRAWQDLTSKDELASDVDLGALAGKFRFTHGQIRDALATARNDVRWRSDTDRLLTMSDLGEACRAHSGQKLNNLARKIEPTYAWEDIVLPEEVLVQLREVCQRVVYRHRVMGDWGFGKKLSLGKGVNVLFAGPSGTGKTMAAEILSRELEIDLYKIDLSGVVSKYIGETEKNLDRVFSAAEDANAILFFDEADALFGKRSEVRDSHDRYANIEISYLLQKMEEYEGLAILATNLRANLDESFLRRLTFTIHFPFPDEADRRRIWGGIWPAQIELDGSVDLDFLAGRFKMSGGNIKNIALAAAFLAAEENGSVRMKHLIHATRREYQKLGKPLSPNELMPNALEEVSL